MKNNNHSTMFSIIIIITTLFVVTFPYSVASLSFNLTSFTLQDIVLEGTVAPVSDGVRLTRADTTNNIGRFTYGKPLRLWDKSSGRLTDFSTHFSFVIDSKNMTKYADGMAFSLSPVSSKLSDNFGWSLGLTTNATLFNSSATNPFVAVEFDIYQNDFDPPGTHVGVDINSMRSKVNTTWFSSIMDGKNNDAWVNYDLISKNLTVVFTGYRENTIVHQSLSYVVDLREILPEQVIIGFSGSTGTLAAEQVIKSWDFNSTTLEDGEKNRGLMIGLIIGGFVVVGGCSTLLLYAYRRRKRGRDDEVDAALEISEFESSAGPRRFTYAEISRATKNFTEKLGEGGFGGVYKGSLDGLNTYVAVKRVSKGSSQGVKEYASEVKIISRVRHRNLVQLLGWCHERGELLLVYEYMSNGSLDNHLFKGKSLLTWETRYKVAQGMASALLYLHEEWEQCVVHRDIKSSNVMLDSSYNAKLGDFGLARLVDHEKGSQTTILAGTMGYMAPESVITGKASKETDVYSFGVVLLEIACGRKPVSVWVEEGQVNLVEWVWTLYGEGRVVEAVDAKLCSNYNEREVENLMAVGLWCAHPDSNSRPTIRQVSRVLNFETALPSLPASMPVATYGSPLVHKTAAASGMTASSSMSSLVTGSSMEFSGGFTTTTTTSLLR